MSVSDRKPEGTFAHMLWSSPTLTIRAPAIKLFEGDSANTQAPSYEKLSAVPIACSGDEQLGRLWRRGLHPLGFTKNYVQRFGCGRILGGTSPRDSQGRLHFHLPGSSPPG